MDVGDAGSMSNIPGWVQILGNVAVFVVVAASSAYAYLRSINRGRGSISISGGAEHGMLDQFAARVLEKMERSAVAAEHIATSVGSMAVLMAKRDADDEIERRVAEQLRARRLAEEHRGRE